MSYAAVTMIWRQVSGLRGAQAMGDALGLRSVGEDAYSTLYDAGGTLLGYWTQDIQAIAADDACSGLTFRKIDLVVNPAVALHVATRDFDNGTQAVMKNLQLDVPAVSGAVMPHNPFEFYDFDGNRTVLTRVKEQPLLRRLEASTADHQTVATAWELDVEDLDRASAFYVDTLGFGELKSADDDAAELDAGGVVLRLRRERVRGLVRAVARNGRLAGDWAVVHTEDLAGRMDGLSRAGVAFPQGIETSGIGAVAYFTDPDGHSFALWEPSGRPTDRQPIDFYPTLERILGDVGASAKS